MTICVCSEVPAVDQTEVVTVNRRKAAVSNGYIVDTFLSGPSDSVSINLERTFYHGNGIGRVEVMGRSRAGLVTQP